MSLLVTGGVASLYVAGVVGLHRFNVWRMRRAARGFTVLRWLDWDALLEGLLPKEERTPRTALPMARLKDGGLPPELLIGARQGALERKRALLERLVAGVAVEDDDVEEAGFSGGEARWVRLVRDAQSAPERALEQLSAGRGLTVQEVYLREHLSLVHHVNGLNLELAVFATKRRLAQALAQHGDHAALYFVRALASSLLGFNHSALNDLARAVYFSGQRPFYLHAVVETAYVEEARPALAQQCRLALERLAVLNPAS